MFDTVFGALLLTIIVEFFVICFFVDESAIRVLFYSVLINGFTQPLAMIALYLFGGFILVEFLVFLVEVPLLMVLLEIKFRIGFKVSFIANLLTASMSLIIDSSLVFL